jgi:hypothetical protein
MDTHLTDGVLDGKQKAVCRNRRVVKNMARLRNSGALCNTLVVLMSLGVTEVVLPADSDPRAPPFVCRMSFRTFGIEYGACIATLVSPTDLLTNASCIDSNTVGKMADVTCGKETRRAKVSRVREERIERQIFPGDPRDQTLIQNNLAIFSVYDEKGFATAPATLDKVGEIPLSLCSIATFDGIWASFKGEATSTRIAADQIDYFGHRVKLIKSKKVTDAPLTGAPLLCKDQVGHDVLKGIAGMFNDSSIFYPSIDQNLEFVFPPSANKKPIAVGSPTQISADK